MAAEDKCIGRLTLDIKDVQDKVNEVNAFLSKIGANVNLEKKLTEGIRNALNKMVNEAKKAGEEAKEAVKKAVTVDNDVGIESTMAKMTSTLNTYVKEVDEAGEVTSKLVSSISSGFDAAGNKIKEFANSHGAITKRTEEVKNAVEAEIEACWKAYEEEKHADEKKAEAAVEAGLKREAAAAKASQAEQDRAMKDVATMEEAMAKRVAAEEAALEKEIQKDAEAQEKKRQAAIDAEFAREEARKKEQQAEEERIAKDLQTYEDALAKEQADLDKQVAEYEAAEEKKRQAAINTEFEKEEARKRSLQAEEELIAKEIAMMDESIAKQQETFQNQKLKEAEDAYKNLTIAIRNYNVEKNAGNTERQTIWENEINASMRLISNMEQEVATLNVDEATREKILNLIEQAKTAQSGMTTETENTVRANNTFTNQLTSIISRYFSLMALIRAITNLIKNTISYVSDYYDKMNEIRIITGKTEEEAAKLGATYRQLAKDMSVSSLDMADAAIYFTRQGLSAEEIEERLKYTTQYAKSANIEFERSAELITAVVNSMNLVEQEAEDGRNAAQRVADVFLKIGDNAATSGEEIGTAMQKASAAAGAFGVQFEWLAAAIGAVSETTRQEASSIGTAFNTLIARLHNIRTAGYNSEDETKINDIQKALANINITLLDQDGNWRKMETIFEEIAAQWDTLDGKTKSYIATTMAGVKQQNVFLALMEDMSQKIDRTSRQWELYELAMDSAGTAGEKYATYTESITAAQERLTVATQEFYSLLESSVIKKFYNDMAGLVSWITDLFKDETDFEKYTKLIDNTEKRIASLQNAQNSLKKVMDEVNTVVDGKVTSIKDYSDELDALSRISPVAAQAIDDLKNNVKSQAEAFDILNDEIERLLANQQSLSLSQFVKKYSGSPESQLATSPFSILKEKHGYDENDPYSFTNAIKEFYKARDFKWGDRESENLWFTIQKALQDIAGTDNPSTGDFGVWEDVGSYVWESIVGGMDSAAETEKQVLSNKLNEMIADAIMVSYHGNDQLVKDTIKDYLMNALTFGDGDFSSADYAQSYEVLRNFARMAQDGIENILTQKDYAKTVAKKIFGDDGVQIFEERGEGFAKAFMDGYSRLIESGLTDHDIREIINVSDIPISEYANLYEMFADRFRSEFQVAAEDSGLDELSEKFNTLDLAAQKFVYDYMQMGVSITEINRILTESENVEEFENKLKELYGVIEEGEETKPKTLATLVKEAKASIKDIQALDAAIKDIQENKDDFNVGDVFGLAEAHPELLTVIGDTEKLLEAMKKVREEASKNQRGVIKEMILGQEGAMTGSKYSDSGYKTLQEYRDSLTDQKAIEEFDAEVEQMVTNWQQANENAKKIAKETKVEAKEAEKSFNNTVKEVETLDKTIAKLQDNKKIDFSDIINLAQAHPEIMNFVGDTDAMIDALERLKDQAKLKAQTSLEEIMLTDDIWFKNSEFYNPNYKNLNEYLNALEASGGDWQTILDAMRQIAKEMVDGAEASSTAAETWLEAQMKVAEVTDQVNWAKSNHFSDQINALQQAVDNGGIQEAITLFESWDDQMQQAVGSEYPAFVLAMVKAKNAMKEQGDQTEALTKQTKAMDSALKTATKLNNIKYFTDSAKAIKQLEDGTMNATDAYDAFMKEANKVSKAYEDILDVQNKLEYNAKDVNKGKEQAIDAADVSNLASLLNMTTDQILDDFPAAVAMFDELTGASGELQTALNMLNDAAFIRITGTSDADFSAIEAGLIYVQNLADEAVKKLLETGQWEVDTINMDQTAALWNWDNADKTAGHWTYPSTVVGAQVLKPTGKNPFSGQSTVTKKADQTGKKGGGGGGGDKDKNNNFRDKNVTTEVERMLDMMSQVNTIQQSQQNYYQSQNKYYSQTGQLQGVIAYMEKEREVLEAQNGTLEGNIKRIEEYIAAKQKEIATLSTDDEAYKDVADDLDKLQKAHQTYTKQLVDNKTAIDSLTESIKEQQKKIRQMEIDLRNLVLKAIQDREKKKTDMLNAEIQMENTIFELIKKRYEKERDQIIETSNLRIEALQKEKDLLSEQLQIRKEQQDAEEKEVKLRELEAKYQRILADPTRRKEAQSIKSEIDSLRKEMAWDLAENEVKAQQEAIDQQITSLEDYVEYVQNYYEDLFEHPQKLIAEMRDIMSMTQSEMIEWLKLNDEAYKESSENTQMQMVEGWNDTYNEMKGILIDYWDEVEQIIAQGDDYIIEFLKNNASEYASAGRLQAEAYVDEWKKQLEDLHKAYQTVTAEVAANYQTIQQYTGDSSGSSSKSSGGGGGGSSNKNNKNTNTNSGVSLLTDEVHGYSFQFNGKDKLYQAGDFATKAEAQKAAEKVLDQLAGELLSRGYDAATVAQYKRNTKINVYDHGGLAKNTGLAWVDGSPDQPERILNPYQTQLFETMVESLERMSRISVDSMPNIGNMQTAGGGGVSVGDIIVNVENLDTDDDYEELADKVSAVLMDRLGRSAAVGGLRIRST